MFFYKWRNIHVLSIKSPTIVNIMRMVCMTLMQPGSQGEWTGMCMCEQWWLHCANQWRVVDIIEWACVLCGSCIQNYQVEQQIYIRFWVKLEHSSVETIWMIQKAFRDNAMSAAQIKVWHKHLKDSWESVESEPCSGRPATSRTPENVEHVWAAINKDQRPRV